MIPRIVFPLTVGLLLISSIFGCRDKGATETTLPDTTSGPPVVRKPNIYLYPETVQNISVQLVFPFGGRILQSDPDYGSGWRVFVEPNGRINGRYDYLFYEAQVPDHYQYSSGWVVGTDTLSTFFVNAMARAGFNRREIADFLDFWVPRLQSASAYEVYPQLERQLNRLIQLEVRPVPQNQLRLFFLIRPVQGIRPSLTTPQLAIADRRGYHLSEWGVVLK